MTVSSSSLAVPSFLRVAARAALDLVLPPLCLACDRMIGTNHTLCPECWSALQFIAPPLCDVCGAPFDVEAHNGSLCRHCREALPVFTAARSVVIYGEASKKMILSFKHNDRTHTAAAMAAWMVRAGSSFWQEKDCAIVPVPLHRWRLFRRRYNQSALLAQHIGRLTDRPVVVDGLRRLRHTPPQGHMGRDERGLNVQDAFAVEPGRGVALRGKSVVLIDDVLTTGATVNECARVLLEAGARQVNILTLARVRDRA